MGIADLEAAIPAKSEQVPEIAPIVRAGDRNRIVEWLPGALAGIADLGAAAYRMTPTYRYNFHGNRRDAFIIRDRP